MSFCTVYPAKGHKSQYHNPPTRARGRLLHIRPIPQVSSGYYTYGGVTTTIDVIMINETTQTQNDTSLAVATRTAEGLCEPGFWCERGFRYPCEAGSFGSGFGLTHSNCSGPCSPGYICGNGSVSPEERSCGVRNPPVLRCNDFPCFFRRVVFSSFLCAPCAFVVE